MTISIVVQRGVGDRQGADIVDPLITAIDVALSRGRAEIDMNENLQDVSLTTVYRSGVRTGMLAEVHDQDQGTSWRGKIVGVQHRNQGNQLTTVLTIKKVAP